LGNQIIRLLTDENLRKKMVETERFIEIYRYALAGKPSEAEYKASNDI
jgi:hypothetical protein